MKFFFLFLFSSLLNGSAFLPLSSSSHCLLLFLSPSLPPFLFHKQFLLLFSSSLSLSCFFFAFWKCIVLSNGKTVSTDIYSTLRSLILRAKVFSQFKVGRTKSSCHSLKQWQVFFFSSPNPVKIILSSIGKQEKERYYSNSL